MWFGCLQGSPGEVWCRCRWDQEHLWNQQLSRGSGERTCSAARERRCFGVLLLLCGKRFHPLHSSQDATRYWNLKKSENLPLLNGNPHYWPQNSSFMYWNVSNMHTEWKQIRILRQKWKVEVFLTDSLRVLCDEQGARSTLMQGTTHPWFRASGTVEPNASSSVTMTGDT